MLKPLTTEFRVLGSGFKTLKDIQRSYEELRNAIKQGNNETKNIFKGAGAGFGKLVSKIKSGTTKIGNSFMTLRTRAETALNRINKSGNSLTGTLTRIAGLIGGGMLIRNAFEGATTLEMQRSAIASMRGQERADELMKFGINFANVTPYQTSEVLDAIKTLEIRGLDPTQYLEGIGNMSAMLGKPLEQGVEAILDAVTGEFERLKEFGITKKMLEEQISVGSFDNKGSLINQKKMFDDLMRYINQSYAGGMENLSRTTTGLLSTVKGIYGSFTNMLFTGSETGTIADKSPLGVFKNEIVQPLADNMMKWQKDGTFTRWSENFAKAFSKFYNSLKKGVKFIWENREALMSLLAGYIAFKTALATLNIAVMLTNPIGLATLGISALAGAFVYLYRNSEGFRNSMKLTGDFILQFLVNPIETLKKSLEGYVMMLNDLKSWGSNRLNKANEMAKKAREDAENEKNEKVRKNIETINFDFFGKSKTEIPNNTKVVQPIININGGDTAQVRKVVEDVIFENEIKEGRR